MPRRRPWLAGLGVLALAALITGLLAGGGGHKPHPASVPPQAAPPQAAPTLELGANVGRLFNDRVYGPTAVVAQLRALRAAGATVARSDAPWEATEPVAPVGGVHHYDWSFDDAIAADLAVSGLSWLPILDYSTPWARAVPGQDHSAPNPQSYAAYAGAFAARYGPGGAFWRAHPALAPRPVETYEIWNEPDNPVFWFPKPDAAAYAELYLRAREAIRAAQPGAQVIVGGLTEPRTFLPALLSAAGRLGGELDGVAIHPYGATPQTVLDNVVAARLALARLGLRAVPLYVTEFGWTTSPPGALDYLSAQRRPAYIEQTLDELGHSDCGLDAVVLYAWLTPERNPGDPQDWFGISPPRAQSTPDTAAFARGVHAATASGPTQSACGG